MISSLQHAPSTLRDADPVLARLIDNRPDFDPDRWEAVQVGRDALSAHRPPVRQ